MNDYRKVVPAYVYNPKPSISFAIKLKKNKERKNDYPCANKIK